MMTNAESPAVAMSVATTVPKLTVPRTYSGIMGAATAGRQAHQGADERLGALVLREPPDEAAVGPVLDVAEQQDRDGDERADLHVAVTDGRDEYIEKLGHSELDVSKNIIRS